MFIDVDAPQSFIGGAKIDHGIVDGVVDFWNDCDYLEKEEGHTGHGVDKSLKDSLDLTIPRYIKDKRITAYIDALAEVTIKYVEHYHTIKSIKWDLLEDFNIQWYPRGGGFHSLHCERSNAHPQCVGRVMAWMTFLNTIESGGETYFEYQQCKVKASKGLTLIWPADWTHFHKGCPAPDEEKMIITGWYDLTF